MPVTISNIFVLVVFSIFSFFPVFFLQIYDTWFSIVSSWHIWYKFWCGFFQSEYVGRVHLLEKSVILFQYDVHWKFKKNPPPLCSADGYPQKILFSPPYQFTRQRNYRSLFSCLRRSPFPPPTFNFLHFPNSICCFIAQLCSPIKTCTYIVVHEAKKLSIFIFMSP